MAPSIRLPSDRPSALSQSLAKLRQVKGLRDLRKWTLKSFPLPDLPLRIRPAFVLLTFLSLLVLSLLGFHPTLAHHLAPPQVPLSDKVLHFVCFAAATALFYACWVVDESARRVAVWRYFKEAATVVVCMLVGGIGSEFLQSLLPYKTFQPGDVVANLLGSGIALALSHHGARQARREAELRTLYSALGDMPSDDDDDDEEGGVGQDEARRPLNRARRDEREREMEEGRSGARPAAAGAPTTTAAAASRRQAQDPWSAGDDEIFGLGGDDDDDEVGLEGRREGGSALAGRGARGGGGGGGAGGGRVEGPL
ncbi:hypothetical protein JCM3775_002477 [Rhodotorula graminis]